MAKNSTYAASFTGKGLLGHVLYNLYNNKQKIKTNTDSKPTEIWQPCKYVYGSWSTNRRWSCASHVVYAKQIVYILVGRSHSTIKRAGALISATYCVTSREWPNEIYSHVGASGDTNCIIIIMQKSWRSGPAETG